MQIARTGTSTLALLAFLALAVFADESEDQQERQERVDRVTHILRQKLDQAEARAHAESAKLVKKARQKKSLRTSASTSVPQVSVVLGHPPSNISRASTSYDWCDCKTGLESVTIWPSDSPSQSATVSMNSARWIQWDNAVSSISWSCDNMDSTGTTDVNLASGQWLSLNLYEEPKDGPLKLFCSNAPTGRLHWNVWTNTDYTSSIPFTTKTEDYACFKIPSLLWTAAGTLIAFAEARSPECSDFSSTDLVYKRSVDGGKSWSTLSLLVSVTDEERQTLGLCGHPLVIGNVAPVQLGPESKYPGRILAPHNRNNYETWLTYSDDDGVTWSTPVKLDNVDQTAGAPDCTRNMSYFGLDIDTLKLDDIGDFVKFMDLLCHEANDPFQKLAWQEKLSGSWQWVGVGPPGGLQLKSGRVIIPAYHSYIRGLEGDGVLPISQLYNNFGKGHVLISDDFGDTWRLGSEWPLGEGANENQLALLTNGSVLSNSRSLSTGSPQFRLQARSDDEGETFTATHTIPIPEPFNGCQGSTVSASNPEDFTGSDTLYVANPDPSKADSALQDAADLFDCNIQLTGRDRVSIWRSTDGGSTFPEKFLIDSGLSAQTSLQYRDGKIMLLYEQADQGPLNPKSATTKMLLENLNVLLPNRFVLREVLPHESRFV